MKLIQWLRGRNGRNYRSELDLFLEAFNAARRTEPASRRHERLKHERVVRQRDQRGGRSDDPEWSGF